MEAFATPSSSSGISHGINSLTLDPSGITTLWSVFQHHHSVRSATFLSGSSYPDPHHRRQDFIFLNTSVGPVLGYCFPTSWHPELVGPYAGTRLLVSSHKSVHFLYDAQRPHLPPLAEYRCRSAASFYVRAAFSPDGTHFITGSSENNAYIWQVGCSPNPLHVLIEKGPPFTSCVAILDHAAKRMLA